MIKIGNFSTTKLELAKLFTPAGLSTAPNMWVEGSPTTMYKSGGILAGDAEAFQELIRPNDTNRSFARLVRESSDQEVRVDGNRWWMKAVAPTTMSLPKNNVIFNNDFCIWIVCIRINANNMSAFGNSSGFQIQTVYNDNIVYATDDGGNTASSAYTGLNDVPVVMRYRRSGSTVYFASTRVPEIALVGSVPSTFTHDMAFGRSESNLYLHADEQVGMLVSIDTAPTEADLIKMNYYTYLNWGVTC